MHDGLVLHDPEAQRLRDFAVVVLGWAESGAQTLNCAEIG